MGWFDKKDKPSPKSMQVDPSAILRDVMRKKGGVETSYGYAKDPGESNPSNMPSSKGGGFRKGGPVKKTGKAKVHKGEYVIKKAAAQKIGKPKLAAMNKGKSDVATLKRAKYR